MFDIQELCNFLVKNKKSTYASGENDKNIFLYLERKKRTKRKRFGILFLYTNSRERAMLVHKS